jgi:hypothetical protein
MPNTAIDQAPNLTSIRLKVPTGTVPIPPEGYGQLHTTGDGQLAVRLPDGSVVEVGGGDGGNGVVALTEQSTPPDEPEPGKVVLWQDDSDEYLHMLRSDGNTAFVFSGDSSGGGGRLILTPTLAMLVGPFGGTFWAESDGDARLVTGAGHTARVLTADGAMLVLSGEVATLGDPEADYRVETIPGQVQLAGANGSVQVNVVGVQLSVAAGHDLVITGLPTDDPGVAGRCWRDPVTHTLKVSGG